MLTHLRHARVFAPEPLGTLDLLVAGETLVALGPELGPLPQALRCRSIDLQGATVIPGLIDAHAHLSGGGGEAGPATRIRALTRADLLEAGVTTVVGLLGTDTTTRSMTDLVARALGLRAEGLSAYCWTGGYSLPVATLTGSVRGDLAFVDPVIGVGELAVSDHRSSQPTLDELLRVAADCHVGGLMSGKAGVLHLHLGNGERGLELVRRALDGSELPARTFHPTHVNRRLALFDEAEALTRRGVTIDVTAFPSVEDDELSAADAIERHLHAGLPPERVTCSTDAGGCLPTFDAEGRMTAMDVGRATTLLETLRELSARGLPLDVALRPLTVNVAEALRLRKKGRLAPGMDADLAILDDRGALLGVMARGAMLSGQWLERREVG